MAVGRPTVYDVAERAGVSIATVSFAFRRPDKVRPETREAVLRVARELGYLPSGSARNLARGRTGVLGLHLFDLLLDTVPHSETPRDLATLDLDAGPVAWDGADDARISEPRAFPLYVDEVQRGFVLECKRNGVAALLSTGGTEVEIADSAGQVDGLAVLPGKSAMESLDAVTVKLPVVMLSSRAGVGHRVLVDNEGGERLLVDHFVDRHGARTLGWVGARTAFDTDERRNGFFAAIAAHDEDVRGEVLDEVDLETATSFAGVLARADAGTLPDVLICATDQIALALMDELRARGVSVPRDVRVAGFDGIQAGRLSAPTLTTVRQPMELMGRLAAHLLLTDPGDGSAVHREVKVAVGLRLGASCGCGESSR